MLSSQQEALSSVRKNSSEKCNSLKLHDSHRVFFERNQSSKREEWLLH